MWEYHSPCLRKVLLIHFKAPGVKLLGNKQARQINQAHKTSVCEKGLVQAFAIRRRRFCAVRKNNNTLYTTAKVKTSQAHVNISETTLRVFLSEPQGNDPLLSTTDTALAGRLPVTISA